MKFWKLFEEIWRWLEKKLESLKEMMSKFWELGRKIVVNHISKIYRSFDRIYNIIVLTRKDYTWIYSARYGILVTSWRLHLSEPTFFIVIALTPIHTAWFIEREQNFWHSVLCYEFCYQFCYQFCIHVFVVPPPITLRHTMLNEVASVVRVLKPGPS